jgi:hypothetical protein
MRARVLLVVLGAVAALAAVQPSAGGRSVLVLRPRVHTVARPRGMGSACAEQTVNSQGCVAVVQDKDYIAWLTSPRPCQSLVVIEDLRTGRRTAIPAGPGGAACYFTGPLALVGSRAYWNVDTNGGGLWNASVRDPQRQFLAQENFDSPPVSDGKRVYLWSSAAHGSILRFRGLRGRRFSDRIAPPAELAAGGGRFARATFPRHRDVAFWPAWSPDGKKIAYVRGPKHGDSVCAWDDPVFCRDEPLQLWLVNADGTGRHLIAARGITPAWSPDGTKLAYGVPNDQVVIANADGSDPQVVTSGLYPAWSPDGHELAVQDHGSIWVVSTDGTNRHRVLRNADAPAWSPDGSQLVFLGTGGLRVANADGSNNHSLGVNSCCILRAAWSPDGSEIAYGFDNTDPNVCEIRPDGTGKHCLHLAGSVPIPQTQIDDYFWSGDPAWGPAPGQLVFTQEDEQADSDFHLVTWPGGRQVTTASPEVIRVSTSTGRNGARIQAGGTLLGLAVSSRVLAGLIRDPRGGWSVKIYQPRPRTVRLPGRPNAYLSASGTTLVFQIGHSIETLNALRGSPHPVATTSKPATSISIFGRRIAWADHDRIHTLNLP